jgi:hypothetical protein
MGDGAYTSNYHRNLGRSVLRDDSKVRVFGLLEGLPKRNWNCLCGRWVSNAPGHFNEWTLEITIENFVRGPMV